MSCGKMKHLPLHLFLPVAILGVVHVCVGLNLFAQESASQPYNPYARMLAEANLEPTQESLTGYLQSLIPSPEEQARRDAAAAALITRLGATNYSEREKAMRDLIAMAEVPRDKLQQAVESSDPEIRWRAELVLKATDRPNPLPEGVCRTIALLKIKGAAPTLLKVIPEWPQGHLRRAAEEALAATAQPEDGELLLQAIRGDDAKLRAAAVTAYGAALGDDALPVLRPLLTEESVEIRLAAVEALANLGDREVLPHLLKLLEHDDIDVRARSVAMLRGLTGRQFGFLAYEDAEGRNARVADWKQWHAEHGQTAELTFPLSRFIQRAEIGHTLILVFQQHKALELNAAGEIIWEKEGLDFPWAVQRLDNGNTVVGSYRGKYVVEFDPEGNELWRKDGLPGGVFGLQRLNSGNTLLGLHSAKKVIEINRAGETVWEATFDGQPMGVQRLANGNTVVALHSGNKVVEVDPAGKVIWEVSDVKIPRTVQRLANGNTLVGDSNNHRAVEFDREGNVVWSHAGKGNVYDARRLSNGDTLISDTTGVRVVNRDGEIVWEKKIQGAGRAIRF